LAVTVNTTSPEPVLPAASFTLSTSTYVPGFTDSVLNWNVSSVILGIMDIRYTARRGEGIEVMRVKCAAHRMKPDEAARR
jgi:hypothetical protein